MMKRLIFKQMNKSHVHDHVRKSNLLFFVNISFVCLHAYVDKSVCVCVCVLIKRRCTADERISPNGFCAIFNGEILMVYLTLQTRIRWTARKHFSTTSTASRK